MNQWLVDKLDFIFFFFGFWEKLDYIRQEKFSSSDTFTFLRSVIRILNHINILGGKLFSPKHHITFLVIL